MEGPTDTNSSNIWLLGWVSSYVSKWIGGGAEGGIDQQGMCIQDRPEIPDDLSGWEWIMSSTEEFLQKHTQWQMERTVNELNSLRGTSQFKLRPRFMLCAANAVVALSPEDRAELDIPLESSERSKVITDIIRQVEEEWRLWIKTSFFEGSERWGRFDHSYSEQPYSKNTVGILREVGWQASHGQDGTLPAKVLADITWSICNALRGSIRGALDRDLTSEELSMIGNKVCAIQTPLIQMWIQTVRHCKGGRAREGKLVRKWQEQEALAKKRIASLRAAGAIDGKYEGGPVRVNPWERASSTPAITAALAAQLFFRKM